MLNQPADQTEVPGGQPPRERDPIAIVGMGCRLPGGVDSPTAYWDLLTAGTDALIDVPAARWNVEKFYDGDLGPGTSRVRRGGFLSSPVDEFDAAFFSISPREADHVDPQQRLLLEVAWEALEDAGATLEQVSGSPTGVFIGGFTLDYSQLQFAGGEAGRINVDAHTATGVVMTLMSNRISYAFDLLGPSMTVDTACSSSLVAVHLACRSLWSGESTWALAGGVNLMLTPNFTIAASQGGFLSPTSRSRAFDASADGYVRGEGVGIVVLRPLADALRDRDRVYAVIRGTGVTQDGHTNGITVPNGASQERTMRAALSDAGVCSSSVSYVEAHGTGTPVGDPIEAGAIGHVYGADRQPGSPCLMGSVKTNIGHLEGAAGVAGLMKAALVLAHREVPPHLHLTAVNPAIDLPGLGLDVPRQSRSLREHGGVVRAAVNSFGFGGTNAHAVLESAPTPVVAVPGPAAGRVADPLLPVFPLSARGPAALACLAGRYVEALDAGADPAALASAVAHRRTHHRQARLAVVMSSPAELHDALAAVRDGAAHPAVHQSSGSAVPSPLAFVFTGMGPQWWGMGRQLLTGNRVFREAVERCHEQLRPLAEWSLMDELLADESSSRMTQTAVSQPANFALQVGLTELWSSLGVRPDVVVGHSAGEAAAAYVAGALSFADAVTVIFHRARLQSRTSGQGRLVAVALTPEQALDLPAVRSGRLALAAVNSPTSVALVGPVADLEQIATSLDGDGVFCRFVDGDVPYHSTAMDPLEADLRRALAGLQPLAPTTPLWSTVTGQAVVGAVHDASYWWRNVRQPVRFADAASAMIDAGASTFVEVGPAPVLAHALADCLRARSRRGASVPSLARSAADGSVLANSCAQLYAAGFLPDWSAFHERNGATPLPAYPWQRERYWMETDESRTDRLGEVEHPLLGTRRDVPSPTWRRHLDGSRPAYLAEHRVMDANLFPGAGYVEMALAAGRSVYGATRCVVEDVHFWAPVVLRPGVPYVLDTSLDALTGTVEVHGRQPAAREWVRHASARLTPASASVPRVDIQAVLARCSDGWDRGRCYDSFRAAGFDYGSAFQSIDRLWLGEREAIGRIAPQQAGDGDLVLDPVVLDGCFQMLLPLVGGQADLHGGLLPVGVDRIVVHGRPTGELWAHATARTSQTDELCGDVILTDSRGQAVLEVRGFRLKLLGAEAATPRLGTTWLHEVVWEQQDGSGEVAAPVEPGTWLVLADRGDLADAVVRELRVAGQQSVVARPGPAFEPVGRDEYELRQGDRDDTAALVRAVAQRAGPPVRGVVHLWAGRGDQAQAVAWAAAEGPLSVLHLVQALDHQGHAWPLSFVTVGAQPVDGGVTSTGLSQAPLWGIGRVLNHESLTLGAQMIDLDPHRPLDDVQALVAELLSADKAEDQVAWRAGVRLVARLQPSRRDSGSLPVSLRRDATYLITGGLGALGLLFARWLAERGARHVLLAGRSALPPRASWAGLARTDSSWPQVAAVLEVEALGAVVEPVALDVADARAVRSLFEQRRARGLPPVAGVLHAAGVVRDQVLVQMTPEQLVDVLRPKVLGAWNLHEALAEEDLDFFALFSSVSSLVVTSGQANYAAGNAFLDALAYFRRGRGLPALSVNWGPWDTGMIADLGLQPLYARRGLDLLPARTGIAILQELLGSDEVEQVVVSAHWPTLIASHPIVPPLIAHLARQHDGEAAATGEVVSLLERLAGAPTEQQLAIVEDACAGILAGVLRLVPDKLARDEPLNQLGLDSMIAVEVRIRLEQALGAAPKVLVLLQGATVTDVAGLIQDERARRAAAELAPDTAERVAELLAGLDPGDAEALLAEIELSATGVGGA